MALPFTISKKYLKGKRRIMETQNISKCKKNYYLPKIL
jgi:hypothetical protein